MRLKAKIMDEASISRAVTRLTHELLERGISSDTVIVGVERRGAILAKIIKDELYRAAGISIPAGSIDITFYRDDLSRISPQPVMNGTQLPFDVNKKNVILVDDVLYTGRTVRCAIDALFRRGRPDSIKLLVLIDRGQRELPFKPDFVGKNIPTSHKEVVRVKFSALDNESSVEIFEREDAE